MIEFLRAPRPVDLPAARRIRQQLRPTGHMVRVRVQHRLDEPVNCKPRSTLDAAASLWGRGRALDAREQQQGDGENCIALKLIEGNQEKAYI